MNLQIESSRTPRVAQAILERELLCGTPLATTLGALFGALESVVSALVGLSGYRSLMRHALHRTASRSPSWLAFEPTASFPRDGWAYLIARVGSERVQTCATELLATIIDQLCGVIGSDLTYRLVERACEELHGSAARAVQSAPTHDD